MKRYLLLLALLVPISLSAKDTVVYHTSDTHGFYFAQENRETGELKGGFAALAAVLKSGPQPYLLLDSGDFSNGTIEAKKSKGLTSVQLMNAVGYHACTIGNHEFDFKDKVDEKTGKDPVETMLQAANFPILAANFFKLDGTTYPIGVRPYKIFDVDGVKIGVIGLANITPTKTPTRYTFADPLTTLKNILPEVEQHQPAVVLAIVHDGYLDDKHGTNSYLPKIATDKELQGRVQVVFGGHVHKIRNEKHDGVLYVESGTALEQVSKVTITTDDKTGKFVSAKDEVIPLDIKTVGEDADILKLADSLREPGVDEVIGYTSLALSETPNQPGVLDNPLDNWLTDIYYAYIKNNPTLRNATENPTQGTAEQTLRGALVQQVRAGVAKEQAVDVFIFNTGTTRTDLPKGKITRRDLISLYPHDDDMVRMPIKGKDLATIVKGGIVATLSDGVVQYKTFYTYSGLDVVVHRFGEPNENGQSYAQEVSIWVNGKALADEAVYWVVTTSYIAFGGSEGKPFADLVDKEVKTRVGDKGMFEIMVEALRHGALNKLSARQQAKLQKTGRVRVDVK